MAEGRAGCGGGAHTASTRPVGPLLPAHLLAAATLGINQACMVAVLG